MRGAHRGQCAVPASRDRMQFDGTTKSYRKSGFGLKQLRNGSSLNTGMIQKQVHHEIFRRLKSGILTPSRNKPKAMVAANSPASTGKGSGAMAIP